MTLLEIQELALIDVNANKELKAITEKRITEYFINISTGKNFNLF